ncbi:MAG TPA: polymer-forming cytoskeletal protein [Azoarcus taiwanensis]|nr:polymer-forming cytoskeletal protein [Azoarcus taiwanensis]HRQ57371.1 polymer-forming cytoskeletal protein [Azoarcus taiwanensis]
MFNKPNLFPKTNEPQALRSGRPAGAPTGATGGMSDSGGMPRESGSAPSSSFGAGSALASASRREEAAKPGESRLIVGPDVKLKGAEILDCDTLVVEGRVEATMDSRVLRIAENGSYSGTVGIDVAEINGSFDGELTARSQLIIHATGKVSGKIRYGKIFIEEGGQISGDIRALDAGDAGRRVAGASTSSAKPEAAESKTETGT